MENWTQTLGAGPLLGIALGAIALILVLIIKFRLHALLTMVLVSLLTAIATGLPMSSIVNDVLIKSFGGTLGSVALLVGLGAMLGRLVETSGGRNRWPMRWCACLAKSAPHLRWVWPH